MELNQLRMLDNWNNWSISNIFSNTQEDPSYECGVVTDEGGAKLN